MFVGHYAAAFALKGVEKRASLGMLFIATQFVDILFFPFVNLGIERLNIIPNFTASTHFELEYYPFTHGLLASVLWAILFYALYKLLLLKGKSYAGRIGWIMALGVLSHWFADLIVHTSDLPLVGDESPKLGFGLWNYPVLAFGTEAILLIGGFIYYLVKTSGQGFGGRFGAILFVVLLLVVGYLNLFILPAAEDTMGLMTSALLAYGIFAGIAFWIDRLRT